MSNTGNDAHGKMACYQWHGSALTDLMSSVPVETSGKNLYYSYHYSPLTVTICLIQ